MKKQVYTLLIMGTLAVSTARAAAPVYDPSSDRLDRVEQQVTKTESVADQLRQLQEEVQTLRGMVEMNEHQIKVLTDRQRDLYADLDSRINELKTEGTPKSPAGSAAPVKPQASAAEKSLYSSAYELMQEKQYSDSITAFNQYLKKYPNGQYAPNALYWMGETQLIGKDLDAAEQAFKNVLAQYPTHQKSADALLKLGYVYEAGGQKDKAVKTLNEVAQKYPGSSLAKIAEQRIQQIKNR